MNECVREALTQAVSVKHFDTQSPFIFCGSSGKPYGSIKTAFRNALKRAGLEGKGYVLHTCSHTFASKLVNAGVSLYVVGCLLGHKDGRATRRYAHLSPGAMRDAVALLTQKGPERAPEGTPAVRYNQNS